MWLRTALAVSKNIVILYMIVFLDASGEHGHLIMLQKAYMLVPMIQCLQGFSPLNLSVQYFE